MGEIRPKTCEQGMDRRDQLAESRSEGHLIAQPVSVHISLRTDPMRGGKYSLFEGGIRANSFVSGGLLPAAVRGTTLHGLLHVSDWSV